MPSAGKTVVQLVNATGAHVAWVEIRSEERPRSEPVVLLWGTRTFIWRTVSQAGYFVFAEASVLISRTPAPGLPSSTDGRDCAPADALPDHPVVGDEGARE